MVSVEEAGTAGFYGTDKTKVDAQYRFSAGPFGPKGGLQDGQYTVGVTMPIVRLQPKSVQRIIGSRGEHLRGPLVARNQLGVSVSAEKTVVIGGSAAVGRQFQRQTNNLEACRLACQSAERLLGDIENARRRKMTAAEWAGFLRSFNSRADSFEKQIENAAPLTPMGRLKGVNPRFVALKANPFRSTYSEKTYLDTRDNARSYLREAKQMLEEAAATIGQPKP